MKNKYCSQIHQNGRFFILLLVSLSVLIFPGNIFGQQTAVELYDRGVNKMQKGDHAGAIADCTKAIELNPRFGEAYKNRGLAWQAKGELDAAIQDFGYAVLCNVKDADAYAKRGNAKKTKGDLAGAKEDLDKAEKLKRGK
jgi:tetratricopeptide (TPR) repeat protein